MHCYFIRWIVVKYLTQIIWHIGNRYFPLGHTTKSSVAVLLGRKYLYNWKQPNLLGGLCGPVSPKCLHVRPISSISSNPPDAYSCFWKICVWKRMKISKKRPELAHLKNQFHISAIDTFDKYLSPLKWFFTAYEAAQFLQKCFHKKISKKVNWRLKKKIA